MSRAPVADSVLPTRRKVPPGWGHHPSHSDYWQREALANQSGMLEGLTGGLVAPRCYGVAERPDEMRWTWLEDVAGTLGSAGDSPRYGLAARHLGQFNGAFLGKGAVPPHPWLSNSWVRQKTTERAAMFDPAFCRDPGTWTHPLVRRGFPEPFGQQIIRIWSEREMLLDGLDRLPQTLCHLDAYSRNLFARRRADGCEETVAIDWALIGRAAIGTDAGQLAASSLWFGDASIEQVAFLWDTVLTGYLEGLADAGWRGDARLVRFGAAALAAVRWGFFLPMVTLAVAVDERQHTSAEQRFKASIADIVARRGLVCSFLLERAEEARTLLAMLELDSRKDRTAVAGDIAALPRPHKCRFQTPSFPLSEARPGATAAPRPPGN